MSKWLTCVEEGRGFQETLNLGLQAGIKTHQRAQDDKKGGVFFRKAVKFPGQVETDLQFVIWAVRHGISFLALNDPLLDKILRKIGGIPITNRHTLTDQFPKLSEFIEVSDTEKLSKAGCVSICVDGWSDRKLRSWLDMVFSFVNSEWEMGKVDTILENYSNYLEESAKKTPVETTKATSEEVTVIN